MELHDLVLEGAREASVPEIPAVELLQEAGSAAFAELSNGFANEHDQLRGDLFARRLLRVAEHDLADRPWVSLSAAPDHHGRGSRRGEHGIRLRVRSHVAGGDDGHVDELDEL